MNIYQAAGTEREAGQRRTAAAHMGHHEAGTGGTQLKAHGPLADRLHDSPRMQTSAQRTAALFGPVAAHGSVQLATLCTVPALGVLPHWEVVAKGTPPNLPNTKSRRWQVGLANPRQLGKTSGSVSTKSASPSGVGGEGAVRWTELKGDSKMKSGYTEIVRSTTNDLDQQLLDQLPKEGTRETYRLTHKNCQHFVVTAWLAAGLKPDDIEKHLTLSEEGGHDVNSALLGTGLGLGVGMGVLGKGLSEDNQGKDSLALLGMAGMGALATVGANSVLREGKGARRHAPTGLATAGMFLAGVAALGGGLASLASLPLLAAAGGVGLAGMGVSRLLSGPASEDKKV